MSLDGLTRALYHSDTAAVRLGRMTPLGFAGGLLDLIGGGGPIVTSTLLVRNRIRLTVDRDRATGGDRIPLGLRGWSAAVFAGAPSGRHPVPAALMDVNVRGRRSQ